MEHVPSDTYARNPAREVEKVAAATVAAWLGDRGSLVDNSSGHGPDFRLDYTDGRAALGEVGWHEDPKVREMWANTFKRDQHQVIELPTGLGQWTVGLERGAHIGKLYAELPALLASLVASGRACLDLYGTWPRGEVAETARRLGVEYVAQVSPDEPAVAVFFMPGTGGAIPTDANAVADWIEEVLADPDYRDTTEKLLVLDADERHVFLMSGTRTAFGVDERLRRLGDALPMRPPRVPTGITHVWAVARFGGTVAGLWVADHGWSAVSLDEGVRRHSV